MKSNYLNNLEREFYFVTDDEREQIISEYQVHFEERIKEGATESEVISGLGTPKSVAIEYATELGISYSTSEKYLANFKRDSNIYIQSLKQKMHEVKNENAAKRNNLKTYVGEYDEQVNNSTAGNDNNSINSRSSIATKIGHSTLGIFYAIKVLVSFCIRIFIKFFIFIIGVSFAIYALGGIVVGLLLPIFITFTNNAVQIWSLIYGSIISLVIFFAIISVMCLKQFGSNNNE